MHSALKSRALGCGSMIVMAGLVPDAPGHDDRYDGARSEQPELACGLGFHAVAGLAAFSARSSANTLLASIIDSRMIGTPTSPERCNSASLSSSSVQPWRRAMR